MKLSLRLYIDLIRKQIMDSEVVLTAPVQISCWLDQEGFVVTHHGQVSRDAKDGQALTRVQTSFMV